MVSAGDSVPGSLATIVAEFHVPLGWDSTGPGTPVHDQFKGFLRRKGLWGDNFLYGSAPNNFEILRQLISQGFVGTQSIDLQLRLVPSSQSRDFYCNRDFLIGERVVVIYSANMLKQVVSGAFLYVPSQASRIKYALAAVVLPKIKISEAAAADKNY